MISAVDGQPGRVSEPGELDLWAGPPKSFTLCVVEPGLNILVLLPSQTATPFSPGRGGARAGAAGVRRVCVRDVCGPESDTDMPCPPCVVS